MEEPIPTIFDPFAWPRQLADYDLERNTTSSGQLRKPKLEGAPGFDRCWDALEAVLGQACDATRAGVGFEQIQGSVYSSFYMQVGMQMAHVLTIDPDQVAVLPEWESTFDPIDYANNLRLPFERVFIDVEDGLGRSPNILLDRPGAYRIHGCLVEQPGQRGPVRVTPLGYYEKPDDPNVWSKARYIPFGHMIVGAGGPTPHASLGSIDMNIVTGGAGRAEMRAETVMYPDFKSPDPDAQSTWSISVPYLNHVVHDADSPAPEDFDWSEFPPARYADVMAREEPFDWEAYLHIVPPTDSVQRDRDILAFATGVWAMMDRFMQILFFLDTPQVELVDVPVSRQVRRHAERKGIPIARRIEVHHSSKRYPRKEGESDEANYSHRFEVRGHYKYFPEGTQMADARKDELRYVPGRGPCRKIWCPPFIKGSDDKPFIPKTRHLRDK